MRTTREERVKLFQDALATREAREKARAMGEDPDRLRAAVPHLTDRELADLSARAAQVKDVAAGHGGTDGALVLLGVLLLVAGIAVLVAVERRLLRRRLLGRLLVLLSQDTRGDGGMMGGCSRVAVAP